MPEKDRTGGVYEPTRKGSGDWGKHGSGEAANNDGRKSKLPKERGESKSFLLKILDIILGSDK
jgi:hypothetical protein